jgi:hypothetical protein
MAVDTETVPVMAESALKKFLGDGAGTASLLWPARANQLCCPPIRVGHQGLQDAQEARNLCRKLAVCRLNDAHFFPKCCRITARSATPGGMIASVK